MQAHLVRAAEVKKAIEWIMCNLDDHYAADSVAVAIVQGALAAEAGSNGDGQISSLPSYSPQRSGAKVPAFQDKGHDATSSSNVSKNFRCFFSLIVVNPLKLLMGWMIIFVNLLLSMDIPYYNISFSFALILALFKTDSEIECC